jgi:hypothetical protein
MTALGDAPRGSGQGSGFGPLAPRASGSTGEHAVLRLSERFPSERCIRWNPLPDSYHLLAEMVRSPHDEYKLVVAQAVLKQVDAHLHAAGERPAVGLLLGQIYDCPATGVQYSLVRAIERLPDALVGVDGEELSDESWRALEPEIARHGARVLGWYRSRGHVSSQLPPLDAAAHMRHFRHPWQVALLVSPDVETPRGNFFVYEARVGRVYTLPFHELLDVHPLHGVAGSRTWVRWQNYVTDADLGVLVAQTQQRAAEQADDRTGAGFMRQLTSALEDAWTWTRLQRRPPPPLDDDDEPVPAPRHRRTQPGDRASRPTQQRTTGPRDVNAMSGGGSASRATPPDAPRVAPPPMASPSAAPPAQSPPPRASQAAPPPRVTTRNALPPSEFDADATAAGDEHLPDESAPPGYRAPLVVLMSPEFHDSADVARRRGVLAGLVLVLLVLGTFLYGAIDRRVETRDERSAPESSYLREPESGGVVLEPEAPPAASAANTDAPAPDAIAGASAVAPTEATPAPAAVPRAVPTVRLDSSTAVSSDPVAALQQFDDRANRLSDALGAFRVRLGANSRICAPLNDTRAQVRNGFDGLTAVLDGVGPALDLDRNMRYNKLAAEVSDLEREWRRSRCARVAGQ